MTKKWVVVVGTMFGNKTIHGPFDNKESVNRWIASNVGGQPCEVVELNDHGI